MKSSKVTFQNSQKLLAENLHFSEHSISKAGYVTAVLAIVRTELCAREASSFCHFWKMTSCEFTLFYLFLTQANIFFIDMLGKEYYN